MRSKYRNVRCFLSGEHYDRGNPTHQARKKLGERVYDSMLEARHARMFRALLKAGEVIEITEQKPFHFRVNGKLITYYKPDFLVTYRDGRKVAWDSKGRVTADFRIKAKWFQALYPEYDLWIVDKDGARLKI